MDDGAEGPNVEHVGAEFAKAFQELAKGERTASALESRLTNIESRIDQLLASIEEHSRNGYAMAGNGKAAVNDNEEIQKK